MTIAPSPRANCEPAASGQVSSSQAVTRDEVRALMAVGDLPTLDQLFARPAWMADAACRGSAVNFHPERGQDTRAAKAVCAGCLVRDECRSYALGVGDKFGVWGGTTAKDRRSLLRRADPSAATSSGRSNSARARVDSARQRVV